MDGDRTRILRPDERKRLRVILDDVDARCAQTLDHFDVWPCQAGCDHCCKSLSREPQLTRAEWDLVTQALRELPQSPSRDRLEKRLAQWPERVRVRASSVVCPLLDDDTGTCAVYAARPAACRSYGFYRARAHDAWCDVVAEHVDKQDKDVVWGSQDALERRLRRALGPAHGLSTWIQG